MDARGRPTSSDRCAYQRPWVIAGVSAGIGVGSALLLLLLRAAAARGPLTPAWAWRELSTQFVTYVYLATSTGALLGLAGFAAAGAVARLEETSHTDPLTQVANRRAFEERLQAEILRAADTGLAVSFMLVDVDELKRINDRQGHVSGDAALRRVAEVLVRACRSRDMVARWGGDEFAVVMSRTRAEEAAAVAERVHEALEAANEDPRRTGPVVSVSIGIADHGAPYPVRPGALFEAADRALMSAKRKGRHRTSVAPGEGTGRATEPLRSAPSVR